MIQLKVYTDQTKTEQHWIDLYETEPIKLTLSIEDITNAEATSVFSRTFRVPATGNNNEFFKMAFLIDGIDYDVTIKKPAEILVDGAEFRQGHIRLQKIFMNGNEDRIDYEIIFLGETRDFASAIGDAGMCDINTNALEHALTRANIIDSWDAYPETASATAGLLNGDVIYPLIDFGNEYPLQNSDPSISFSENPNFHSHPLPVTRMKPMIRAKALWDAIFDNAGYTYSSAFIEPSSPNIFTQLYVSAFGNEPEVNLQVNANSANNFSAVGNADQGADGDVLECPVELSDPNGNYNNSTYVYTAPVGGSYTFTASANAYADRDVSSPSGGQTQPVAVRMVLMEGLNVLATGNYTTSGFVQLTASQGSVTLAGGEQVRVEFETEVSADFSEASNQAFACTDSPGLFNPIANLDCEYKQIDFIKDVLTTFRLVMAPDPNDSRNFIIEPWVDYAAKGDVFDWSGKLVNDKDFVIEPLFFTQSDLIEFDHNEDGDWLNTLHFDQFQREFGYLEFTSGNELLKGKREIKTEWAPTPLIHVDGDGPSGKFIIPQLLIHEENAGVRQKVPIKPKTRFLFYNGLQDVGANNREWELGTTTKLDTYPLVSYSSVWPMTGAGQILNWNLDVNYWGDFVAGYPNEGQSLYQIYWSSYINSLYGRFARRVTAYFILNNTDLQKFSFDDVIFVNGTYYRPEKIYDAQIGERTAVKVDLIKLTNYVPSRVLSTVGLGAEYSSAAAACAGTTEAHTFRYTPPLTVGDIIPDMRGVVSTGTGFFKILTSTEPSFGDVGKVIEFDSDGEVISIQDVCGSGSGSPGGGPSGNSPAPTTTTTTTAAPTTTTTTTAAPTTTTTTTAAPTPTTTTTTTAAPQNYFYYTVEDCLDQTIVQVRATYNITLAGQNAVIYNGRCYEVAAGGSANTNDITAAYADCAACAERQLSP